MWTAFSIVLGLVLGSVTWPLLRLIPALAQWICKPFGEPGAAASVVALLISAAAILGAIIFVFMTAFAMFIASHVTDPKLVGQHGVLRQYMLAASIVGCFLVGIVMRLEDAATGRAHKDADE
jgi:hypothetical protein